MQCADQCSSELKVGHLTFYLEQLILTIFVLIYKIGKHFRIYYQSWMILFVKCIVMITKRISDDKTWFLTILRVIWHFVATIRSIWILKNLSDSQTHTHTQTCVNFWSQKVISMAKIKKSFFSIMFLENVWTLVLMKNLMLKSVPEKTPRTLIALLVQQIVGFFN